MKELNSQFGNFINHLKLIIVMKSIIYLIMEWIVEMSKFPLPQMPARGWLLYVGLLHMLLLICLFVLLLCIVCCVLFLKKISFMLSNLLSILNLLIALFYSSVFVCFVSVLCCVFHGFDFASGWVRISEVGFSFGVYGFFVLCQCCVVVVCYVFCIIDFASGVG